MRGNILLTSFAAAVSLSLLLFAALQWLMLDSITVFGVIALRIALGLLFLAIAVWSVIHFVRRRRDWRTSSTPLAICSVTIVILVFVPFTRLWLKYEFWSKKQAREEIVGKVLSEELVNNDPRNSRLIALGQSTERVSSGGNEIVVEEHAGKKYILFYTFRGILDNYAGFLFVPKGGSPEEFSDLSDGDVTELIRLESEWFYVSHH